MNKKSHTFFTFLLISCVFFSPTQAEKTTKTQTNALDDLYKSKFSKNDNHYSTVYKSLFGVSDEDGLSKIIAQKGSKEGDRITSLPGQPKVGFEQYGGYVTIDEKAGRAFYYYFAEAESLRIRSPFFFGLMEVYRPGCSSIAYGAMTEFGPFRVHSDGKTLFKNPYAWNNAANVLFLESPAGVGFSYSNTSSDFKSGGDRKTAEDNLIFILNWLERFPAYKDRDFYLSGESYAGHYVPQLAQNILLHNKKANKTVVNLKGIIIGNAAINDKTDTLGMYDYFNTHPLISDEVLSQIKKNCDFVSDSKECKTAMDVADSATGKIDVYNIYYPMCHNTSLTNYPKKASVSKFDPCSDYYVYAYLNTLQVQKALHANVTKLSYAWQPCSDVLKTWEDSASSTLPLLQELIENGLRVWVFSGDTDGRVPVTSTKYALQKMNLTITTPYYPWFLQEEVGGYTQVYERNFTFATVRGAGHEVPSYQPARALSLIMHFLNGTKFFKN